MSTDFFGFIAVALVFVAYIPYLRDIIKGKAKPHPFTWLVWAITAGSIFSIQLANGSGAGAYGSAAVSLFAFTIFVLVSQKSKVKIRRIDIICLVTALVGIICWLVIQQPLISLILLLSIELIGFVPTLLKGIEKPYEDSVSLWGTNTLRHMSGLIAIQNYNILTILNPALWMTISALFGLTLLIRRRKVRRPLIRKRQFRPYN